MGFPKGMKHDRIPMVRLQLTVPHDAFERLKAAAKADQRPVSTLGRAALLRGLQSEIEARRSRRRREGQAE